MTAVTFACRFSCSMIERSKAVNLSAQSALQLEK
jgi:hypothetical protein